MPCIERDYACIRALPRYLYTYYSLYVHTIYFVSLFLLLLLLLLFFVLVIFQRKKKKTSCSNRFSQVFYYMLLCWAYAQSPMQKPAKSNIQWYVLLCASDQPYHVMPQDPNCTSSSKNLFFFFWF